MAYEGLGGETLAPGSGTRLCPVDLFVHQGAHRESTQDTGYESGRQGSGIATPYLLIYNKKEMKAKSSYLQLFRSLL